MDRDLKELSVSIPKHCVLFSSSASTVESYDFKDSQKSREFLDLSMDRCVFIHE
jgi:hypothetical protein